MFQGIGKYQGTRGDDQIQYENDPSWDDIKLSKQNTIG